MVSAWNSVHHQIPLFDAEMVGIIILAVLLSMYKPLSLYYNCPQQCIFCCGSLKNSNTLYQMFSIPGYT